MATASEGKRGTNHSQRQTVLSAVHSESLCMRCGGLMVSDFCMDLLNSIGELECAAKRCVQCGEVVDPVIERNRRVRQDSRASCSLGGSIQSREYQGQS